MLSIDVLAWFQIVTVPTGGAPQQIRAQWVGLPLPVRRPRPVEGPDARVGRDVANGAARLIPDGVVVEMPDAQKILRL